MKIIVEAQIDGIASKVDGTVSIKFGTQELDSSKAGELFSLRGKHCKLLISDSNITTMEAEIVDSTQLVTGKKNKSKSQQLRNVLFVLHQQLNPLNKDFDTFYDEQMEDIINSIKSKLD